MASFRAPTLRQSISGAPTYLRGLQRRWAQVHDIRFVATHQRNSILDKYKDKLTRKAQEEGLRDPNELMKRYEEKIQNLKKENVISLPSALTSSSDPAASSDISKQPQAPRPPIDIAEKSTPIKTLSAYLDLSRASLLAPAELEEIWRLRHMSNPLSLCATIPFSTYRATEAIAKKHPCFILPLPKEGQGAEIHFLQWTFPADNTVAVIFTHLAEYKLRGEYSQPHTTITHHLELAEDKGLVLMQGQVIDGRGVTVDEAKWLVMCLQKFYGASGNGEERRRLLEMFGKGDPNFRVEDLISEAEKIG